jgi:hypothetical protein
MMEVAGHSSVLESSRHFSTRLWRNADAAKEVLFYSFKLIKLGEEPDKRKPRQ